MNIDLVGVGTDIIEIARVQKAAANKQNSRFINRVFTENEISFCTARRNPWPSFAARFSAKEAVFKALGTGLTNWQEVEILNGGDKPPVVVLSGTAEQIARSLGIGKILVSVSHDKERAVAFAVAVGKEI
ncbi:holo-[acyl-carrier-protein] synthase [Desulfotomaculum arcticum]|uniref:Holo-[acyl-carrier-protein] synthase n=1 Tax=Desulfotruncus arcticus DSM 17038 TaxID=1121424 RepID=A0A1I2NG44_9FIRM|nr:holo-ACP synthase [Desulfotruncus arcticus]SFG00291.1 holo-[acyl-carrier-protein] synthase [Desulfotomaculum arcticum] [Desulfotruncus arcticus DSM 17038]